jgi:integrase
MRIAGRRESLGVYATAHEAEEVRIEALRKLADAQVSPTMTLRAWGKRFLDDREADGVRDVANERNRWKTHIDTAPFADDPISTISAAMVRAHIKRVQKKKTSTPRHPRKKISRKTVKEVLLLLSLSFDAAIEAGLIEENPAAEIKVRKEPRTEEPWTYLLPAEQETLLTCSAIPEEGRLMIAFALGTGVREGEQFNLELRDVHAFDEKPHMIIRFGSKGKARKNAKISTCRSSAWACSPLAAG